ncbi:DNA-binding transcriptional regulator, MarR family [Acetanaerobacterium elongatum]|uniref:DNA-binding transcriptional regulator, MarR family n=1 Tax=Acetanaerobacterium elongatum TaxID=258515 RepID=A0A1G9UK35_9FIRM|nr:DNA-binding transcriptional regulator, MarR family [Acetanaerobacterium elongatum]
MNNTDKQAVLFGNLFLLANKLQAVSDKYLEGDDITAKQWFLVAAINQFSETPPTLSEVSELIGSSRQNVKQLALKLEKKGFLQIEKNKQDTRAYRLVLTEKCHLFWQNRELQDNRFITDITGCLTAQETDNLYEYIDKMLKKTDEIHKSQLSI